MAHWDLTTKGGRVDRHILLRWLELLQTKQRPSRKESSPEWAALPWEGAIRPDPQTGDQLCGPGVGKERDWIQKRGNESVRP